VTVAELAVNRRQHHPWEQEALRELRDGHVARAVAAYRAHDRVVATGDRQAMLTVAVDRWLDAHDVRLSPVLIAGTNDTVNALNHTVRRTLKDRGLLGETVGTWAGRDLAVGERVVLRINDYTAATTAGDRAPVLNGQAATLVGGSQAGVVVRLDHDGAEIALAGEYLTAGGVDYGYALTSHRAQGGTWDLAISVGAEGLYREAAYLVLSRGREENCLVLTNPELDAFDAELARHDSLLPLPGEEADLSDELEKRLNTSRAKLLALTRDPHADLIAAAANAHDLATLEALAGHARRVERGATAIVGADPHTVNRRLEQAGHTAAHAAVGQRVKALDRDNIGTIVSLDDTEGTVRVEFVATDGRSAKRDLRWEQAEITDPSTPQPRRLTTEAQVALDRSAAPVRQHVERWHQVLTDHGVGPSDRHVHQRAARLTVDRAADHLAATQPQWLADLLGARPTRPAAAQVWDDTVAHIASHRARHHITDTGTALGPVTADPTLAAVWGRGNAMVVEARVWLDTHTTRPALAPTCTRSNRELEDRRRELDAIFELAPADHRSLIDQLHTGGQLPFDDVAELLTDALAAQGERRRWILEHWPHVVEYAQITATIAAGSAGPDVGPVLTGLSTASDPRLAHAANEGAPWLVTLAAQLNLTDGSPATAGVEQLLGDVASYRHRWGVTHPDPLGLAAADPEQAAERSLLTIAIDHAHPDRTLAVDRAERDSLTLAAFDDGIGW